METLNKLLLHLEGKKIELLKSTLTVYLPTLCLKTRCLSSLKFPDCCLKFWVNETRAPRRGAAVLSLPQRFCPNSSHLEEKDAYKEETGVNPGLHKAFLNSYSTKNPPAARHTRRHERIKHAGRISTRVLSFQERKKKKKSHSQPPLSLQCSSGDPMHALLLSAAERSFCPLWLRGSSVSPIHTWDPPICCVQPPQNERVPPTARCKKTHPPRQDI